jgi:transposase
MTMHRKSYLDEAQRASLKDVMAQQPMTLKDYRSIQERRVAARRQMEDMRLRRMFEESK